MAGEHIFQVVGEIDLGQVTVFTTHGDGIAPLFADRIQKQRVEVDGRKIAAVGGNMLFLAADYEVLAGGQP